jgi:serine/threonine-protein kinase RsbW
MIPIIAFPQSAIQQEDIRLELPSDIEFVGPLMNFFYTFLHDKGIDEAIMSNVVTAIIEAATNAITHGNGSKHEKKTTVIASLHERCLRIEILDEGRGFDPEAVPDPLAPENLMNLSGRGIFLMKSLMDSVEFDFSGQGTRLVMTKTLGEIRA